MLSATFFGWCVTFVSKVCSFTTVTPKTGPFGDEESTGISWNLAPRRGLCPPSPHSIMCFFSQHSAFTFCHIYGKLVMYISYTSRFNHNWKGDVYVRLSKLIIYCWQSGISFSFKESKKTKV